MPEKTERNKTGDMAKRSTADLLSEIVDSIEPRTETGLNLKSVHRKLEECGISGYSYAEFCDYFRAAGARYQTASCSLTKTALSLFITAWRRF